MTFGLLQTVVPRLLGFVNQENGDELGRPAEDWSATSSLPGKNINENSHRVRAWLAVLWISVPGLLRTQQAGGPGLTMGCGPTRPCSLSLPAGCIQDPRVPEENGATGQKQPESPRRRASTCFELLIIGRCIHTTELLGFTCYVSTPLQSHTAI